MGQERVNLHFSLHPSPPFRLDLTARALQRRPLNQTDVWDGETYSRVLDLDSDPELKGATALLEVRQTGGSDPRLEISAAFTNRAAPDRLRAAREIKIALGKLLGLNVGLGPFYDLARKDRVFGPLVERYRGLRPPRFPSVFEGILNGISCQQLSLEVGLTLLNRIAAKAGVPFETPSGPRYSFPGATRIAGIPVRSFRALGFSGNKAISIRELSREVSRGKFDPEALASRTDEKAIAALEEYRGIGRWTAEYVLLRGLGRVELFPGDDLGARKALARLLGIRRELGYEEVARILATWRPFAGMLYFHLLIAGLEEARAA